MTSKTQIDLTQFEGHTQGPWTFRKHESFSDWHGNIEGSYGKVDGIKNIRTIDCITKYAGQCESDANAHLIAAAPDLLALAREQPLPHRPPTAAGAGDEGGAGEGA